MPMGFGAVAKKVVATKIVAADGSGDFTDIQTAINALPAAGGVVYIKEGTYPITTAILITGDDVSIIGTGNGTKITTTSDITMINISADDGVHLSLLYIYGDSTKANNDGIYLDDINGASVESCRIENCGRHGIKTNLGTYNLITECLIKDCEGSGIWMYEEGVWTIAECYINSCTQSGIYVDSVAQVIIANNEIGFNENYGIYATNCSWMRILGNNITSSTYDGIRLVSQSYSIIANNELTLNDSADSTTYSGIFLDACDYCNIASNVCWGNDNYGIDISNATCDKNIVIGNQCLGNTTGPINDSGTATEAAHNMIA